MGTTNGKTPSASVTECVRPAGTHGEGEIAFGYAAPTAPNPSIHPTRTANMCHPRSDHGENLGARHAGSSAARSALDQRD